MISVIRTLSGGRECLVRIHAVPGARESALAGVHGDRLRVRLKARPVGGAANAELCRLLAVTFGLSPHSISLRRGHHSRQKDVLVPLPAATVAVRLAGVAEPLS